MSEDKLRLFTAPEPKRKIRPYDQRCKEDGPKAYRDGHLLAAIRKARRQGNVDSAYFVGLEDEAFKRGLLERSERQVLEGEEGFVLWYDERRKHWYIEKCRCDELRDDGYVMDGDFAPERDVVASYSSAKLLQYERNTAPPEEDTGI